MVAGYCRLPGGTIPAYETEAPRRVGIAVAGKPGYSGAAGLFYPVGDGYGQHHPRHVWPGWASPGPARLDYLGCG